MRVSEFDYELPAELIAQHPAPERAASRLLRLHARSGELEDLAIRDGKWKLLCEHDGSRPELYDLETDRGETKNLATEHADIVQRLTAQVLAWDKSMPKQDTPPAGTR